MQFCIHLQQFKTTGKDKIEAEGRFVIQLPPVLMSRKSLDPDRSVYLVELQFALSLSLSHTHIHTHMSEHWVVLVTHFD